VRALIETDIGFERTLKAHIKDAIQSPKWDAERFAKTCIEHWHRLTHFVPEMNVELPKVTGLWGTMLSGAGGGGFGIAFVIDPSNKKYIIKQYQEAGMQAFVPVLMDGLKVEEI